MVKNHCIITLLFLTCITFTLYAQNPLMQEDNTKGEKASGREITSDSLKWEYEKGTAVFTGNVTMKSKESEIGCSKMTVFFDKNDEIEKMVAEGDASLNRETQKGAADTIEVYPAQNLIILKGNAWISSQKALFGGEEIRFDTAKEVINITKGVKGEIQAENR